MSCQCIEEVDAMLNEQQGGQLDISIFYRPGKHSLEARPSLYINRRDTGRVRKAWCVKIMGEDNLVGTLVYAPTAGKARYQKFLSADCDSITFANISVTRAASDDEVFPVVDDAIAALDSEQKSTLTHTLKNGRFYTSTDDRTMYSLAQAGLVRNTGRGWDEGEAYFVLTDTGRTAALSLMPLYPEYPEYRA